MTDIIGVMCTPLGRFPSDRWRGEVEGTAAIPRILLYDDFRFSLSRFRAPGRPSVSVSSSLSTRFGLVSRMRAILSKRQNLRRARARVCVCMRKMEKERDRVTWIPRGR